MGKLFLAFTLIPLIELILLIKIGEFIGALPTILIVIGTGGVGVFLTRSQGLMVLNQIKEDLQSGIVPGNSLLNGLLILIGAVLLITPGLITDLFGFCLLWPFSRKVVSIYIKNKLEDLIREGKINIYLKRF